MNMSKLDLQLFNQQPTQAQLGWGTLVQRHDGEEYVSILEVQSISGPALDADDVDVTNMMSPGGYQESIAGLKTAGEISFNGNLIPRNATHQKMIELQKSGLREPWRIVIPDAQDIEERTKIVFLGYIKSCGMEFPTASQMTYSATIQIVGEPTMAVDYSADLTGLEIDSYTNASGDEGEVSETLDPIFDGETYGYEVSVDNSQVSCRVTPTGAADSLYVNEMPVDTTQASHPIQLDVGLNTIYVRSQDNELLPRYYGIKVTRAES